MTVSELIAKLQTFPPTDSVVLYEGERCYYYPVSKVLRVVEPIHKDIQHWIDFMDIQAAESAVYFE